jgi:hypothetical protein
LASVLVAYRNDQHPKGAIGDLTRAHLDPRRHRVQRLERSFVNHQETIRVVTTEGLHPGGGRPVPFPDLRIDAQHDCFIVRADPGIGALSRVVVSARRERTGHRERSQYVVPHRQG